MVTHNSLKHLVVVFSIILCTRLKDDISSSELLLSKNAVQVSFLKAYARSDEDDIASVKSFGSASSGSSSGYSISSIDSDKTDFSSIRSIDETDKQGGKRTNAAGNFFKGIFKATKGKKESGKPSKFARMFMKKSKGLGAASSENILPPEATQGKYVQESDGDGEEEDDNDENRITKRKPNLEKIISGDFTPYDQGVMQMYLESESASSDAMVSKSSDILKSSSEVLKTIRETYYIQIDQDMCTEELLATMIATATLIFSAKTYCDIGIIKSKNEAGFCRSRCKLLGSKGCKTCKKAFLRKEKCKQLSGRAEGKIYLLIKLLKNCIFKNSIREIKLDNLKFYKGLDPYRCKEEQYKVLKSKLESKLIILSLKISFVNYLSKLKQSCGECTKEGCASCQSTSSCPQCAGPYYVSSCMTCNAIQSLLSLQVVYRNEYIQKVRRALNKLLACESYMALIHGSVVEVSSPSEHDIGKIIEEGSNKYMKRYMSHLLSDQTLQKLGKYDILQVEKHRKLPEEIKSAILSGVQLKKTEHKKAPTSGKTGPTQLEETYKKVKKSYELSNKYLALPRKSFEPTLEEANTAVVLFENGICTHLMIYLLEKELKECNDQIIERSSQHTGCEECIVDGCRKKRCNNYPEIKSLIVKREFINKEIVRCYSLGFLSQAKITENINRLRISGVLPDSTASTSSTGVAASLPGATKADSDEDETSFTTRL